MGVYRKINLKIYEPEKRIGREIKENIVPAAVDLGHKSLNLGGWWTILSSGIFMGIRGLFMTKRKIREIQARHETVLDLRTDKPKPRLRLA